MRCGLVDVATFMSDPTPANQQFIAETQRNFLMNTRTITQELKNKRIAVDGPAEVSIPAMAAKLENYIQVPITIHHSLLYLLHSHLSLLEL
jgi:hypothetical protein